MYFDVWKQCLSVCVYAVPFLCLAYIFDISDRAKLNACQGPVVKCVCLSIEWGNLILKFTKRYTWHFYFIFLYKEGNGWQYKASRCPCLTCLARSEPELELELSVSSANLELWQLHNIWPCSKICWDNSTIWPCSRICRGMCHWNCDCFRIMNSAARSGHPICSSLAIHTPSLYTDSDNEQQAVYDTETRDWHSFSFPSKRSWYK